MPRGLVDDLDVRIINYLLEFEKLDANKMAKTIGTTPKTVYERMKRLRDNGVIEGMYPKLNLSALGYDIRVVIIVKLKESNHASEFAAKYSQKHFVTKAEVLIGPAEVRFEVVFRKSSELMKFVHELRGEGEVEWLDPYYALETHVARHSPFPISIED